jgi:hypothetical protein
MKRPLQAIVAVLVTCILVLVIVDLSIPHSHPDVAAWSSGLDRVTQQLIHAQTPGEVLGAMLYATAVVALPVGFAAVIAIALMTVATRILDLTQE